MLVEGDRIHSAPAAERQFEPVGALHPVARIPAGRPVAVKRLVRRVIRIVDARSVIARFDHLGSLRNFELLITAENLELADRGAVPVELFDAQPHQVGGHRRKAVFHPCVGDLFAACEFLPTSGFIVPVLDRVFGSAVQLGVFVLINPDRIECRGLCKANLEVLVAARKGFGVPSGGQITIHRHFRAVSGGHRVGGGGGDANRLFGRIVWLGRDDRDVALIDFYPFHGVSVHRNCAHELAFREVDPHGFPIRAVLLKFVEPFGGQVGIILLEKAAGVVAREAVFVIEGEMHAVFTPLVERCFVELKILIRQIFPLPLRQDSKPVVSALEIGFPHNFPHLLGGHVLNFPVPEPQRAGFGVIRRGLKFLVERIGWR